jgi:lysozyme
MALLGIDVSEYQGEINWPIVANNGVAFGIIKATEGVESFDPYFERNWAAMRSVGIIRSAYHFFIASKDPVIQAQNFLRRTKSTWADNDLPPVLDLEKTYLLNPATVIKQAQKWIDVVTQAIGRKPIIYTFPNFWEEKMGNPTAFRDHQLWIAHYETDRPIVPGGWRTWNFHQFTESGQMPGISGPVDLNYFNGNLDSLQRLLKGKAPLKVGANGNIVKELQTLLKQHSLLQGNIDGAFGNQTKAAVLAFQKANQLLPDGIVGSRTWAILQGNTPKTDAPIARIELANVCLSYRELAHQQAALSWLQQQIPAALLTQFTNDWRQVDATNPMNLTPILFTNVCKSYRGTAHQKQALQRLQQQLSPEILTQFAKRWRQS